MVSYPTFVVAGPEYARMYADEDKYTQHYRGCITAMDEQVGRLRNELRAMGVATRWLPFVATMARKERRTVPRGVQVT